MEIKTRLSDSVDHFADLTAGIVPKAGKRLFSNHRPGGTPAPTPTPSANSDSFVEGSIVDAINNWVSGALSDGADWATNTAQGLLKISVGTPAPRGPSTKAGGNTINIAFNRAVNDPWDQFFAADMYWGLSIGLALALQFVVLAFVGLRFNSMDPVVRKKVGRRLFFAFAAIFFWLPVASLATQFFDLFALSILNAGKVKADALATFLNMFTFINNNKYTLIVGAFLLVIGYYIFLKALVIFVARWIAIILLTLFMPVIGSFWALEVWPLNRFSGLSAKVAGAYPGLLVAGIPPAIILRLSAIAGGWGIPSGVAFITSLVALAAAAKSQKYLVMQSSKSVAQAAKRLQQTAGAALTLGGAGVGYAAAGPAGAAVATGAQKTAKGQAPSMEVMTVHRDLQGSTQASSTPSSEEASQGSSAESQSGSSSQSDSAGSSESSQSSGSNGEPESGPESDPSGEPKPSQSSGSSGDSDASQTSEQETSSSGSTSGSSAESDPVGESQTDSPTTGMAGTSDGTGSPGPTTNGSSSATDSGQSESGESTDWIDSDPKEPEPLGSTSADDDSEADVMEPEPANTGFVDNPDEIPDKYARGTDDEPVRQASASEPENTADSQQSESSTSTDTETTPTTDGEQSAQDSGTDDSQDSVGTDSETTIDDVLSNDREFVPRQDIERASPADAMDRTPADTTDSPQDGESSVDPLYPAENDTDTETEGSQ